MKVTTTASAIRATITPTEAREIVTLARDATALGLRISDRLSNALALLDYAQSDARAKQAAKRADRDWIARAEKTRREREEYFMIADFSVMATRADYADVSRDPDRHLWVDVVLQECLNRPITDQCEIRRDVWHVRVVELQSDRSLPSAMVGSDCTMTSDRAEVRTVAEQLIANFASLPA